MYFVETKEAANVLARPCRSTFRIGSLCKLEVLSYILHISPFENLSWTTFNLTSHATKKCLPASDHLSEFSYDDEEEAQPS